MDFTLDKLNANEPKKKKKNKNHNNKHTTKQPKTKHHKQTNPKQHEGQLFKLQVCELY